MTTDDLVQWLRCYCYDTGHVELANAAHLLECQLEALHAERAARDEALDALRVARVNFESIEEYWNRGETEWAMKDACFHAIDTARAALAAIDAALKEGE